MGTKVPRGQSFGGAHAVRPEPCASRTPHAAAHGSHRALCDRFAPPPQYPIATCGARHRWRDPLRRVTLARRTGTPQFWSAAAGRRFLAQASLRTPKRSRRSSSGAACESAVSRRPGRNRVALSAPTSRTPWSIGRIGSCTIPAGPIHKRAERLSRSSPLSSDQLVELTGIEPVTSCLPDRRSPS